MLASKHVYIQTYMHENMKVVILNYMHVMPSSRYAPSAGPPLTSIYGGWNAVKRNLGGASPRHLVGPASVAEA